MRYIRCTAFLCCAAKVQGVCWIASLTSLGRVCAALLQTNGGKNIVTHILTLHASRSPGSPTSFCSTNDQYVPDSVLNATPFKQQTGREVRLTSRSFLIVWAPRLDVQGITADSVEGECGHNPAGTPETPCRQHSRSCLRRSRHPTTPNARAVVSWKATVPGRVRTRSQLPPARVPGGARTRLQLPAGEDPSQQCRQAGHFAHLRRQPVWNSRQHRQAGHFAHLCRPPVLNSRQYRQAGHFAHLGRPPVLKSDSTDRASCAPVAPACPPPPCPVPAG